MTGPLRAFACIFATTAVAGYATADAREPSVGLIRSAAYEARSGVLTVPFTGRPPEAAFFQLSPTWYFCDLSPAKFDQAPVVQRGTGRGLFDSFKMAQRSANVVRISFHLKQATRPAIAIDPRRRLIRIAPEGGPPETAPSPSRPPTPAPAPSAAQAPRPTPAPRATATPRPVSPAPAGRPTSTVTAAVFDSERRVLVLPFIGEAPLFRWGGWAGQRLEVELKCDVRADAAVARRLPGDTLLSAFALTGSPGVAPTRLLLEFARPGALFVAEDTARRQLIVIPQPARLTTVDAPITTVFGRAFYERESGTLVLPYDGVSPTVTQGRLDDRFHFIDLDGATLHPPGVQLDAPPGGETLAFWALGRHDGSRSVRLSLRLSQNGQVKVTDDVPNRRLLVTPSRP